MQCIIMENTLIKLTLHDETKKRAHDSQYLILPLEHGRGQTDSRAQSQRLLDCQQLITKSH